MAINNQPTITPRTITGIFTRYMAKTIPLAFDESMSYYECLCALLEYINDTIVPDINNVNDGLGELQGFYEELQSYVNNYLTDENMQPLINNRLDEYVEDGTMDQLINQEIFGELNSRVSSLESDNLSELAVVGDSYTASYDANWAEKVAEQLHLTLHKSASGGVGFTRELDTPTYFITLLNNFNNSESSVYMTETQRNKTKYLITYGGINDYEATESALATAVYTYCERAKELFPNAQIIMVGPQMSTTDTDKIRNLTIVKGMAKGSLQSGCSYTDARFWLLDTPFEYSEVYMNDHIHPNSLGQKIIVSKMIGLITGQETTTDEITISPNTSTLSAGTIAIKRTKEALIIQVVATGTFQNNTVTNIGTLSSGGSKYFIENTRYPVYKRDSNNCPSTLLGGICITSSVNLVIINNSGSDYTGNIVAEFTVPFHPVKIAVS